MDTSVQLAALSAPCQRAKLGVVWDIYSQALLDILRISLFLLIANG
jgi:hypothetical protein